MSATAVGVRTVELLRFTPEIDRAGILFRMLASAAPSAGLRLVPTWTYQGGSDLLVLWGPGHPSRFGPMRRQIKAGGHVLAFDLAYWDRLRKVRVSIDAAHPQAWVMRRDWPRARFEADRVFVGNHWNPKGPVIVAGLGRKARDQYGASLIDTWEAEMMATCRERGYAQIVYRPKGDPSPIESALTGAALCITWHSNVAVDAIRMGIPVICHDGAAAAVCPSTWPDGIPEPLHEGTRERFLSNLAWFQWSPAEAAHMWAWVGQVLA